MSKALTRLRRTGLRAACLHHLLPEGIFSLEIDLRFTECLHSRLPPTHNGSLQVQIFVWSEDVNMRRLFSLRLMLSCHTGSITLILPHNVLSLNLTVVLGTPGALSLKDCWRGTRHWKSALEPLFSLPYSKGNASCFSLRQVFHFATDRSCFCYDSSSLVQFVEHFASCL